MRIGVVEVCVFFVELCLFMRSAGAAAAQGRCWETQGGAASELGVCDCAVGLGTGGGDCGGEPGAGGGSNLRDGRFYCSAGDKRACKAEHKETERDREREGEGGTERERERCTEKVTIGAGARHRSLRQNGRFHAG